MADDDLAALERAERDAWFACQDARLDDYEEARGAWNDARVDLLSARLSVRLARRDG